MDLSSLWTTIWLLICLLECATVAHNPSVSFYLDLYPTGEYWIQFPRKRESECIYEENEDVMTCMSDYDYKYVTKVWITKPRDVKYVKVNCRIQDFFFVNRYVCFCTNSDLSNRHSEPRYQVCQLRDLKSGNFKTLGGLQVLDLSGNYISDVHKDSLIGLQSLNYISLSGNPFTFLPDGILCGLTKVRFVHLSSTGLSVVPKLYANCANQSEPSSVEYLFMSRGRLTTVPRGVFAKMNNLLWLDLSTNYLTNLTEGAFDGASALRVLSLSHNHLDYPLPDLCAALPQLEVLDLQSCGFIAWDHNRFRTCQTLEKLDLSHNQIAEVEGDFSTTAQLTKLNLSRNKLNKVEPGFSLANLSNLISVDLSQNLLGEIYNNFLWGSHNLTHLNLSRNVLSEKNLDLNGLLETNFFVRSLDISHNNVSVLPSEFFPSLSNLEFLDISNNEISEIHPDAFSNMQGPRTLLLMNNHIQTVYNNTLARLINLEILDLSQNEISSMDIESLPVSLVEANFNHNLLYDLPTAFRVKNFTDLTNLYLSENRLSSLDRNCFLGFTSLRLLDLSWNEISAFDSETFRHLDALEKLKLQGNQLILPVSGQRYSFYGATNLLTLNLAFNQITDFVGFFYSIKYHLTKLQTLNMTGNNMFEISQAQTSDLLMELQTLVLDDCNLSYVDAQAFYGLPKLTKVFLRNNKLRHFPPFYVNRSVEFDVTGNPVECSCHMLWLSKNFWQEYGIQIMVALYHVNTCRNLLTDSFIPIQNIHEKDYLCETQLSCPNQCACFAPFDNGLPRVIKCQRGLHNLPRLTSAIATRLYLDGNDFENLGDKIVPFEHKSTFDTVEFYLNGSHILGLASDFFKNHPLLEKIHLENNQISSLSETLFSNIILLKELYLSQNFISVLYPDTFKSLHALNILDLRSNRLHSISSHVADVLSDTVPLRQIYLSGNPWKCSCSTLTFRNWLAAHISVVPDWKRVTCGGTSVVEHLPKTFECKRYLRRVYIDHSSKGLIIGLLLLAVFLVVTGTFIFKIRKTLKALIFAKFRWAIRRSPWDVGKNYDAYVIYNIYNRDGEAENWVSQVLVPKLENRDKPYRLFLPERDVMPGESIVDSSSQNIADCRRTIVCVSESFLTSQWCNRTFQLAYQHALQNKKHKLIILFYGRVKLSDLDPVLKVFVMMGDYLKVDSKFFWPRLYFELPNPRSSHDPLHENDVGVTETDVILQNAVASDGFGYLNNSHV